MVVARYIGRIQIQLEPVTQILFRVVQASLACYLCKYSSAISRSCNRSANFRFLDQASLYVHNAHPVMVDE